jgi:signal transduction histidine kinase
MAQHLPETPVFIEGDEKMLRQAVENLLSNAIKYSPEGGSIIVALDCQTREVRLNVVDQGIGIPADDLPGLFEVFHRASNVGTFQGTGLGLAMVKEVVHLHHGRIEVNSTLGAGTTFCIYLPLSAAAAV